MPRPRGRKRQPVLVDLALQGGGSHGAFTWGVLDRLLEERWIEIEAISRTSAGAMNAAVLADGWKVHHLALDLVGRATGIAVGSYAIAALGHFAGEMPTHS